MGTDSRRLLPKKLTMWLWLMLLVQVTFAMRNVTVLVSTLAGVHFQFDDAHLHSVSVNMLGAFCESISQSELMDQNMLHNCEELVKSASGMELSLSFENVFCLSAAPSTPDEGLGTVIMLEQPDGEGMYLRLFCNAKSKREFTKFWSKHVARQSNRISYELVVARYQEDVSWLQEDQGAEMAHSLLYNKGPPLGLSNEVSLVNVGRESHTYLHYLSTRYSSLPEVVVFTQGDASDHDHVSGGRSHLEHLLAMRDHAAIFGKSKPHVTHYNGSAVADSSSPVGSSRTLNMFDSNFNLQPAFKMATSYRGGVPLSFGDWFMTHIAASGTDYPNPIRIYPNALFAVHRELILQRPLEFYQGLLAHVEYCANPVEGHFLERSWYYVFPHRHQHAA